MLSFIAIGLVILRERVTYIRHTYEYITHFCTYNISMMIYAIISYPKIAGAFK